MSKSQDTLYFKKHNLSVQDIIDHYIQRDIHMFRTALVQNTAIFAMDRESVITSHIDTLKGMAYEVVPELPTKLCDLYCNSYKADSVLREKSETDKTLVPTIVITFDTNYGKIYYKLHPSILTNDVEKLGMLYKLFKPEA